MLWDCLSNKEKKELNKTFEFDKKGMGKTIDTKVEWKPYKTGIKENINS